MAQLNLPVALLPTGVMNAKKFVQNKCRIKFGSAIHIMPYVGCWVKIYDGNYKFCHENITALRGK